MKYAHQKGAQYVALLGAHEIEKNILVLKHMDSGDQMEYSLDEMETIAAIF
jgi:histidyl-tRNA synthetase